MSRRSRDDVIDNGRKTSMIARMVARGGNGQALRSLIRVGMSNGEVYEALSDYAKTRTRDGES